MTQFQTMEVSAPTKEEALKDLPFEIMGEATMAYRKWAEANAGYTKADLDKFLLEYVNKKSKGIPGAGFYITVDSAVLSTKKRPYVYHDVKNEQGARKFGKVYTIVNKETGAPYFTCNGTKAQAAKTTKEAYSNGLIKTDIRAIVSKKVVEGEEVAFEMDYAPSAKSKEGKYIVFGVTRD